MWPVKHQHCSSICGQRLFSGWIQAHMQISADQVKASSIPAESNGSLSDMSGSEPDWKTDSALG